MEKERLIEFLKESAIVIILLLLTVLCFWRIFTTNPKDQHSFSADFEVQNYVFRNYAAQSLRKGEIPLWNPYAYSGSPFNSDPQTAIFYPPNIIYTFLLKDGKLKYQNVELQPIFHIFLAGLFMYIFAKALKLSRAASFVSAVSFMFCGFLIINIGHIITQNASVWLPMVLMLLLKTFEKKSYFFAILTGLSYGISLLAGHPHMSYYVLLTMAGFTFYNIYPQIKEKEGFKEIAKSLLFFGIVLITSFGVAAIQLIPTYEMVTMSARARSYYEFVTQYSLPPSNLITFFIPFFFWGPPFWGGRWGFSEIHSYIGIIPLILATIGLLYAKGKYNNFFIWLAIISLFISFGGQSILHGLLYIILPGFDFFRAPARFLYLSQFSIAVLAGYGSFLLYRPMKNTLKKKIYKFFKGLRLIALIGLALGLIVFLFLAEARPGNNYNTFLSIASGYVFFIIFLLLGLFSLYGRLSGFLRPRIILFILPSLILIDILSFYCILGMVPMKPSEYWVPTEEIKFLQEEESLYRTRITRPYKDHTGTVFRIFTINGTERPIGSLRYYKFLGLLDINPRLLDLLNVKYVLTQRNLEAENAPKYVNPPLKIERSNEFTFPLTYNEPASSLEIISWLSQATNIPQGTTVGELEIKDTLGIKKKFPVRAGIETSEQMYDRPDINPIIKHEKAPIYSTYKGMHLGFPFNINKYKGTIILGKPIKIKEIKIRYLDPEGFLWIDGLFILGKDLLKEKDRHKKVFHNVYENKYVLPKAFFVYNALVIDEEEKLLEKLRFLEPESLVLLEENPPEWSMIQNSSFIEQTPDKIEIKAYTSHKLSLDVSVVRKGFLILSEVYYPGWKAFIDGKETKIYRANYILRALPLEPGNHKIELIYKPVSFKIGLYITTFSLLFIALIIIYRMKKRIA